MRLLAMARSFTIRKATLKREKARSAHGKIVDGQVGFLSAWRME
jgi:hypothetical protein